MVTAEIALALPVLILLLAVALGGIRYGIDQVRCLDAARAGARAAARGDSPAAVVELARRAAPTGARVDITSADGLVRVEVCAAAPSLAGPLAAAGMLPPPRAAAVAQAETGVSG